VQYQRRNSDLQTGVAQLRCRRGVGRRPLCVVLANIVAIFLIRLIGPRTWIDDPWINKPWLPRPLSPVQLVLPSSPGS